MLRLEQVGHPALAGLAVDPDDRLVGPTDVVRVDRQVGHAPVDVVDVDAGGRGAPVHVLEALLDGVLVRAREGRVDEVAAPGVPLVHRQLVAVLDGAPDLGHVGEVDLRVDALAEQVHAQGDEADVAGALAVAEEAALDAVGTGEVAELGGRDALAAVVVRVQADDDRLAAVEVAHHPLDGVGVDVGGRHLDGRREVDDHLVVRGRVDDRDDLVADPHGELELGAGVRLRRVLVVDVGLGDGLLELAAEASTLEGDVDDALLAHPEDHAALQHRGRVVEVDDRRPRAADGVVGALDEVVAALREHLDRHVVGDVPALDELAAEVEVGLARAREADLDLLVAQPHEELEHPHLALGVHRVDEGLVAVAQVDRAPARGLGHHPVGPGAVGQVDLELVLEGHVLLGRHPGGLLGVDHRCFTPSSRCGCSAVAQQTPRRGAADSGPAAAAKEEASRTHGPSVPRQAASGQPPAARRVTIRTGLRQAVPRRSTTTLTRRRTSNPVRR